MPQENYCPTCGFSLTPPSGDLTYVSRECKEPECDRIFYELPKPGEDGLGISVEGPATIHFRPIEFSLRPRKNQFLFREGVLYVVKEILTNGRPSSFEDLQKLIDLYKFQSESFLRASSLIQDLDWDDPKDEQEIVTKLTQNKECQEFHAFMQLSLTHLAENYIQEGKTKEAAWAMYQLTIEHCLFEIGDSDFEEILWQGYKAHSFLTHAKDQLDMPPAQVEILKKIGSFLEEQSELTLYVWSQDPNPVSKKIGIDGLPEETLRALVKFYLDQYEKQRQETQLAREESLKKESLTIQRQALRTSIIAAAIGFIGGVVTATITGSFRMAESLFRH